MHERTEENTKYINGHGPCRPCWEVSNQAHRDRVAVKSEKKRGLKKHHVDWVVVERMLQRGTMEYIKRGRHQGPTDGERWVAYCTFVANTG